MTRATRPRHPRHVTVQSITTAPQSLREEQAGRIRRYLVTMGIRTGCFVLAAVTASRGASWWVWGLFAVLAVVLPYVAVVLANAVRPRAGGSAESLPPVTDPTRQIEP